MCIIIPTNKETVNLNEKLMHAKKEITASPSFNDNGEDRW